MNAFTGFTRAGSVLAVAGVSVIVATEPQTMLDGLQAIARAFPGWETALPALLLRAFARLARRVSVRRRACC